jgi:hypothetical protein
MVVTSVTVTGTSVVVTTVELLTTAEVVEGIGVDEDTTFSSTNI